MLPRLITLTGVVNSVFMGVHVMLIYRPRPAHIKLRSLSRSYDAGDLAVLGWVGIGPLHNMGAAILPPASSRLEEPRASPGTALQIRRPVASSPRALPPQSTALIPSAVSVSVPAPVSKKVNSLAPCSLDTLSTGPPVSDCSSSSNGGCCFPGFAMSEGEFTVEGSSGKEQDRFLPIANISRIMRRAVPENGKIAKDAKESIQECVSEFISFITSDILRARDDSCRASDKCMNEKRKTINGDDLIWSLGTLGFEEYVEPLKLYLKLYREVSLVNPPNFH
ncbi:hypothetical protein PR202_ga06028 [Eleusine coracana subsp. coracana]|uniref:Transcription factor CBF/NF-Y/archaeal histone domain-containing protein n=1 Tax=Eleusine coracana subsp. coracana TaxID=191504 RepID=A0AAV5BV22_ELECO|nr:hypothetical protein PR202_ga06028 [Eleusine coracana subsp. coracana]